MQDSRSSRNSTSEQKKKPRGDDKETKKSKKTESSKKPDSGKKRKESSESSDEGSPPRRIVRDRHTSEESDSSSSDSTVSSGCSEVDSRTLKKVLRSEKIAVYLRDRMARRAQKRAAKALAADAEKAVADAAAPTPAPAEPTAPTEDIPAGGEGKPVPAVVGEAPVPSEGDGGGVPDSTKNGEEPVEQGAAMDGEPAQVTKLDVLIGGGEKPHSRRPAETPVRPEDVGLTFTYNVSSGDKVYVVSTEQPLMTPDNFPLPSGQIVSDPLFTVSVDPLATDGFSDGEEAGVSQADIQKAEMELDQDEKMEEDADKQ